MKIEPWLKGNEIHLELIESRCKHYLDLGHSLIRSKRWAEADFLDYTMIFPILFHRLPNGSIFTDKNPFNGTFQKN
jgi:hypothetical protein